MSATGQSDEDTNDASNDSEESTEQTMRTKPRDLKPEKDPMGAGTSTAPDSSTAR